MRPVDEETGGASRGQSKRLGRHAVTGLHLRDRIVLPRRGVLPAVVGRPRTAAQTAFTNSRCQSRLTSRARCSASGIRRSSYRNDVDGGEILGRAFLRGVCVEPASTSVRNVARRLQSVPSFQFEPRPERGQGHRTSRPDRESVMMAVFISGSPNAMFVVTSPGMGWTSTSSPSGVTKTMPSPMAPIAMRPSSSTARESNEYGVATTHGHHGARPASPPLV